MDLTSQATIIQKPLLWYVYISPKFNFLGISIIFLPPDLNGGPINLDCNHCTEIYESGSFGINSSLQQTSIGVPKVFFFVTFAGHN